MFLEIVHLNNQFRSATCSRMYRCAVVRRGNNGNQTSPSQRDISCLRAASVVRRVVTRVSLLSPLNLATYINLFLPASVRRCEHDLPATGGRLGAANRPPGRNWFSDIAHIYCPAPAPRAADHPCTLDASASKLIGHCWRAALSARLATTRRPSAPHASPLTARSPADLLMVAATLGHVRAFTPRVVLVAGVTHRLAAPRRAAQ